MIDGFLLLAPILLLAVVALFAFTGCSFQPSMAAPDPPTDVGATGGDAQVTLSWTPPIDSHGNPELSDTTNQSYNIYRYAVSTGSNPTVINVPLSASGGYVDSPLVNGTTYFYEITSVSYGSEGAPSEAAAATPAGAVMPPPTPTPFVTAPTLGTLRNDFDGFVGMAIQVGAASVAVKGLGRIFVAGNIGMHQLKIVDAGTGNDVPGSMVTLDLSGGGTANQFSYVNYGGSISLNANASYYIVSQEASGGDQWYDDDTTVSTTNVAAVTSSVFIILGQAPSLRTPGNHAYVPVDFLY